MRTYVPLTKTASKQKFWKTKRETHCMKFHKNTPQVCVSTQEKMQGYYKNIHTAA